MRTIRMSTLAFFMMPLLSGCATVFTGTTEHITIRTDQDDARIYVDGRMIGRGTASFRANRTFNEHHIPKVTVKKKGYETQSFKLERTFNATAITNSTFVYSWTTDFFSGAMFEYTPNKYMIQMVAKGEASLTDEQEFQRYVLTNSHNLKRDIARGGGDYLSALNTYDVMKGVNLNDNDLAEDLLSQPGAWAFYSRLSRAI